MEELKRQFQEFISGLMSLPINFPGTRFYRSLQAKKKMTDLVRRIIESKRKNNRPGGGSTNTRLSTVDVLMMSEESSSSDEINKKQKLTLTDELIAENMIDMMIPGEDSVPLLITLAVKYLSDSPPALQKMREENMELKRSKEGVGEHLSWTDYMSLSFTQSVITETLRMGNIIIGVMRKAVKEVEVKGYIIPKGWCVFPYFRSVHLDDTLYDRPYEFYPWRWQEKETSSSSISSSNFTPFGGGQRLCPGLDLARLEASIFLHHLVTRFSWVAEEDSVLNFPTVKMKRKMPIWVKPRRS